MMGVLQFVFIILIPFAALEDLETCPNNADNCTINPKPEETFMKKPVTVSNNCWCDLLIDKCDINCCCDADCSDDVKKVFRECAEPFQTLDLSLCYAADFLQRNDSYVIDYDGLFCIAKKNVKHKREFKPRKIIYNIEDFDKSISGRRFFTYNRDFEKAKPVFDFKMYKEGDGLWIVIDNELRLLELPTAVVGNLCSATKKVKFLNNELMQCDVIDELMLSKSLHFFNNLKFINSPNSFNKSDFAQTLKNCTILGLCLKPTLNVCNGNNCQAYTNLTNIKYGRLTLTIIHNGTEGLKNVRIVVEPGGNNLMQIEVKYLGISDSDEPEMRSGNPGYIFSRPIPTGNLIPRINNSIPIIKKGRYLEHFPLGDCSQTKKIPFGVDILSQCLLPYKPIENITKGCIQLQEKILKTILKVNLTELFVPTYGNSPPEKLIDWIPILKPENEPVFDFQQYDGHYCKNLVKSINIDIVFSLSGEFNSPQAKILSVRFRFGRTDKFLYNCFQNTCRSENSVRLENTVNFIDLTKPAVLIFPKPPGLNIKFPHDFFYPFLSGKSPKSHSAIYLVWFVLCLQVIFV